MRVSGTFLAQKLKIKTEIFFALIPMANGKRIGVKLYSDLARELKRRAGTVTRPLEKFAAFNSSFSAVAAAAAAAADSHPSVSDDHKTFSLLIAVTLGAQLRRIFKTRLIQPDHFVPYQSPIYNLCAIYPWPYAQQHF